MNPTPQITERPVASLVPYTNNPRTHTDDQIAAIARSIEVFGFTNPVLIDRGGGIIAGHGRVLAAQRLGMTSVPTICLNHLSEAEKRAYVIADNRLAELAGWDSSLLAIELVELSSIDVDLDVTITGFSTPEIDLIIEEKTEPAETEDPVPLPPVNRRAIVTPVEG